MHSIAMQLLLHTLEYQIDVLTVYLSVENFAGQEPLLNTHRLLSFNDFKTKNFNFHKSPLHIGW